MMHRDRSDVAGDFMLAASEDLSAARALQKADIQRPTVYHMQQATEKMTKAVLVALTDLDLGILHTHNSPKLVADLLEWTLDRYGRPLEFIMKLCHTATEEEANTRFWFDVGAEREKVSRLRRCADDRVNLRANFATYLRPNEQSDLKNLLGFAGFLIDIDVESRVSRALQALHTTGLQYEAFCDTGSIVRTSHGIIGGALRIPVLAILGMILLHHDQDPRYPALASHRDNVWAEYTPESPLVLALPTLLPMMEGVHSGLSAYVDHICGGTL